MKKRYWMCIIGPADHDKLSPGSNTPLRDAVEEAFRKTQGADSESCWSGWGMSEARLKKVLHEWNNYDTPLCPNCREEMVEKTVMAKGKPISAWTCACTDKVK